MTEFEKMINGEAYFPNDELSKLRDKAKDLCLEYNNLYSKDNDKRNFIIKSLFGKVGKNFLITAPFYCDYGINIEVGDNFYTNHNCVILDCSKVIFGNNVFIAPNCGFYTAYHPLDFKTRNLGVEYALPITIGDNVWIGANTIVLPNVKIGNGVVVGAGSVVTKDIPDNVLAFGNPCRVIRSLV